MAPHRTARRSAPGLGAGPHLVLPLVPALAVAAASSVVYALGFPRANVWILAFVGVAGLLVALRGRTFWTGLLVGFVGGAAFWWTLVDWITLFLGLLPLIALATLEALLVAVGGGLIAVVYRRAPRIWAGRGGRLLLIPLLVAGAWTAREAVASTAPYGGFGWGRLAESQSTSPFAPLVAWFGFGGTSFVLVWLVAFAVGCATEPAVGFAIRDRTGAVLGRLLAVAIGIGLLLAIPPFAPTESGSIRVAAVQPDTHSGYFDPMNDPQQNLDTTVRATLPALDSGVDLIVWPEGASEDDPLANPALVQQMSSVTSAANSWLLAGALTARGRADYNSSLLLAPGQGIVGLYDKVHPVPFGEYVPDRTFWTPFAPDLLKLIGRDYTPGRRSSVLDVNRVPVGVDICFDIVDDGLILGSVGDGAQVLVAQTNNADFGTTEENEQQLAIARLRAIETGRAIVTDSTVASTTIIAPDGRTLVAAAPFRRQVITADVPLATGTTPAVVFGIGLNAALSILGGVIPLVLVLLTRRRRGRAADNA